MFGGAVVGYGMASIGGFGMYKGKWVVMGFIRAGITIIQVGVANGYGKGLEIFLGGNGDIS